MHGDMVAVVVTVVLAVVIVDVAVAVVAVAVVIVAVTVVIVVFTVVIGVDVKMAAVVVLVAGSSPLPLSPWSPLVFVLVVVSLHHVPPFTEHSSVGTFVLHKFGLLDQTQPTHPNMHVACTLRLLRRCLPVHLEYICTLQEAVTMLPSHVFRTTAQHTLCTNYNATTTNIVERYHTDNNQIRKR
jgi:hypothetical protein